MAEPIRYIDRTRNYYLALGYDNPYQWAKAEAVAFTPLSKPLDDCTVAVVTTAAPFQTGIGDQGPRAAYNAKAKFYQVYAMPSDPLPDLRISHVAIDRDHTTAEDLGSYLPLRALKKAEQQGVIGKASSHVFGLPTNRSQRKTIDEDAPLLAELLIKHGVDAAVFVPNCPICHQSAALAANTVEAAGIPSVIMGCALDIITHVGAPRFVFSDFPLGNSAGRPHDIESQDLIISLALDLLKSADASRSLVTSPLSWTDDDIWKNDYSNPDKLTADEIAAKKAEFDRGKHLAKEIREKASNG